MGFCVGMILAEKSNGHNLREIRRLFNACGNDSTQLSMGAIQEATMELAVPNPLFAFLLVPPSLP
jgi:hypothetical protein